MSPAHRPYGLCASVQLNSSHLGSFGEISPAGRPAIVRRAKVTAQSRRRETRFIVYENNSIPCLPVFAFCRIESIQWHQSLFVLDKMHNLR